MTVYVNAIMYYRVVDAVKAVINVDDYSCSAQASADLLTKANIAD